MWWWSPISKPILDLIGDPQTFISIVLVAAVIMWWHKEMKANWSDYKGDLVNRLEKSLQVYSTLEISILLYLRNPSPESEKELLIKLGQDSQYFSPSLQGAATHFIRYQSVEQLKICLGIVQDESPKLRSRYLESVPNPHKSMESIFHFFEVAVKALTPVIRTFCSIAFVAFIFSTIKMAEDYPFEGKVSLIINVFIVTVLGIPLISFFFDEEFRRRIRWKVFIFLSLLGGAILLPKLWYVKIIMLVAGVVGMIYIDRRLRRGEKFEAGKSTGIYL